MHDVVPHYRRSREVFCRLVPRPTRVLLLDADAETIQRRKSDLTPDTLHRFLEIYRDLATRHGWDTVKVDDSPERVATRVVGTLFDEMSVALRR